MRRIGTLSTMLLLILSGLISCASTGDPAATYSKAQLEEDYSQFRGVVEKRAAGLYTDRSRLQIMLDRAEEQIEEGMNEIEFYRLLAPAVAELRCGHTFLSVSEATEAEMRRRAHLFPLDVRILGGKLYVLDDPHGTGVLPGSEILTIDGRQASEAVAQITANMPTDGRDAGRPRYDTERWFAALYYSYIDQPAEFRLEIRYRDDRRVTRVTVPALKLPEKVKTSKGVVHDTVNSPWSTAFTDRYAYLKIPVFLYSDKKAYNTALEEFFDTLASCKPDRLILDLRGNYGGTPAPTVELFKYLIQEPTPFFAEENPFYLAKWKKPIKPAETAYHGELYILMDEACFSMNSFLISLLKYHEIGTLVGAPSSGSYICSDASRSTVLKNTGIRFRYSTAVFRTAVEGQESGIGIEPDIRVEWTLEDYLAGNDPVLAAALEDAGVD